MEPATATEAPAPAETTATAVEPETTATSTATETTTPITPEAPATTPAKSAVGAEDYAALKARALKGDVDPTLLEKSADEPSPETTTPTETPVETPPATETPAEVPPVTEPPAVEPEPEERTPERIRLSGLPDGHLVALANKLARDENISFGEAFNRVSPKPAAATPVAPATTTDTTPQLRSRVDVESEIQATKAERKSAAAAADALESGAATRMVEAEEKLETLNGELANIELAESEAEAARENQARTAFETTVTESAAKTVQYWPEAKDPNSALSKRVLELADQYEKDPNLIHLTREANSPFYFTQMAAQELGLVAAHLRKNGAITPTPAKPSAPTATKPAPVNQRAVGRPTQPAVTPASGAARTTQESAEDKLGLDKVRSPHEYNKLIGDLTGQRR